MIGRLVRGAVAGTLATVPMSAVMLAAGRLGLMGQQPPEAITRQAVASAAGTAPGTLTSSALATLVHLGFGATTGAVYAAGPARLQAVPAPARGAVFAVGVWAVSYRGWVPRFGALPHAEHDRDDRVVVMVAAHVLFGAALGALYQRWSD